MADVVDWRDEFPAGRGECVAVAAEGGGRVEDEEIKKLKQNVGELVLNLDIAREG